MDRGGVRTGLMMGAGGRPSVRRASASTASSMSSDMVRTAFAVSVADEARLEVDLLGEPETPTAM